MLRGLKGLRLRGLWKGTLSTKRGHFPQVLASYPHPRCDGQGGHEALIQS